MTVETNSESSSKRGIGGRCCLTLRGTSVEVPPNRSTSWLVQITGGAPPGRTNKKLDGIGAGDHGGLGEVVGGGVGEGPGMRITNVPTEGRLKTSPHVSPPLTSMSQTSVFKPLMAVAALWGLELSPTVIAGGRVPAVAAAAWRAGIHLGLALGIGPWWWPYGEGSVALETTAVSNRADIVHMQSTSRV